jgi:hypothetical protein
LKGREWKMMKLTKLEKFALEKHWNMKIRQKGTTVEAKKGECYGLLYATIKEAKDNALIILKSL